MEHRRHDRLVAEHRHGRPPAGVIGWTVAAVVGYGIGLALGIGQDHEVGFHRYELFRVGCCVVGIVGILDGVRRHRPRHAGPWLLLALLVASWTLRPIKDLWLVGGEQPYLGGWWFLAQVSSTAVAFVGALWAFLNRRRAPVDREALLDVVIMVAAYASFLIHVSVVPGWSFLPQAPFRIGAGLVYPVSMAAVLTLASYLVFIDRVPGRSFVLLWAAIASTVLPNLLTLLVQTGSAVAEIAVDTAPLTIFLFCAAAADPTMTVLTEPSVGGRPVWSTTRSVMLGCSFVLPMVGLLAGERPHGLELVVVVGLYAVAAVVLTLRARRAVDGLVAAELSSRRAAATDPLTGLLNRRGFVDHLGMAVDPTLGIAFVDLDRFKPFNDAHGHGAGDDLLRGVAERITAASGGRAVARLGGDEFAVAYHAPTDRLADEGDHLARSLQAALAAPIVAGAQATTIRASIGLAEASATADPATGGPLGRDGVVADLLRRADLAQYEAKAQGGGQVVRFSDGLDQVVQRTARVLDALQPGDRSELRLVYQAVVRTVDQVVVGAESLARLRSDALGEIPAYEFIVAAERNGLIVPVGRRLLDLLVADLRADLHRLPEGFRVSLNVSPLQLDEHGSTARLEELARTEPEVVAHIRIEVTESAVATDATRSALVRLSDLGYQIAIDDFGSDYASLQYLASMPVDVLKLDRAFVAQAIERPIDQAIIRHVVDLAGEVGIDVVAEGVETLVQHDLLVRLGCPFGQGYLWDRPAPGLGRLLGVAVSVADAPVRSS